jgi:cellulose 1,4-beta-cellobiosidase
MRQQSVRRRLATLAAALAALVLAGLGPAAAPAHAAVLFADDFEQPSRNLWLTGSGGVWSTVTEDGSKVWRQSGTAMSPTAWAGWGSGPGTGVTVRAKPAGPLIASSLVGVAGRVSDPNNLYYAGVRGGVFELGQQAWGRNVVLATTPFTAVAGAWHTLRLDFPTAATVTGTVTGPGGVTATLSAADPGGIRPGDKVGVFMIGAAASFDDIALTDGQPTVPPAPCPVTVDMRVDVDYGSAFTGSVGFTNISSAPIAPPWTLTWRFAQGQTIQTLFIGQWHQVGPVVTVRSVVWFPAVPPGATSFVRVGFQATGPGRGHPPTEVTFNGAPCAFTFS